MIKGLFALCALMAAPNIFAATNQLDIGFGPSLPKNSVTQMFVLPTAVSRVDGGEHLYITFKNPKYVSSIKVVAYSVSRSGKILVRSAVAVTDSKQSVQLDRLSGMLSDFASVMDEPRQAIVSLDLVVEGFAHNDASVLLQIVSSDDLTSKDFVVNRSGAGAESVGEYFAETNYARFSIPQVQLLMKISQVPELTDLVGKSFVCTTYSTDSVRSVDFKTRQYFSGHPANVLQSASDLSSKPTVWIRTELGWTISIAFKPPDCAEVNRRLFIRMTPEQNIITEWSIDLSEFVNACVEKGYRADKTREAILSWAKASLVDSKFIAAGYEFCRQIKF